MADHGTADRRLRLGIAGLGRGFMAMRATLSRHPRVVLAGAADPREEARRRFAADCGAPAHATVEELCADPTLDAVYVATPHQFHAAHVALAAAAGKHILVEKPMALTLEEAGAMIAAADAAGVHLIVGHTHGFDAPILRARDLIAGGEYGAVRMITAMDYTDFLYRPRRPEELATERGGGVMFNQAPHQVDVVRLLGGGLVRSVRAVTGAWDQARPTEGAYSALLTFENGAVATLTYSGYAHFDSDEFCGWVGESGQPKDPERYGQARRLLGRVAGPDDEAAFKSTRIYGGADEPPGAFPDDPPFHQHFGVVVVSCDRADLRPTPRGVLVYGDADRHLDPLPPPTVPRAEVLDELCAAVLDGRPPVHGGAWGLATLEVCLAMLRSAREGREVTLSRQVAVPGNAPIFSRGRPDGVPGMAASPELGSR
ncbi:4,5-dihydroxyphthalate dehydrogenase [Azospirillum palustre]|uniref:4,5-dihydroxyphthalate dehydrogenase n=1 Tax=Azospirillum palustre TaxID=2044885 RepID=A0A2B8BMB3_9PROT|nr:MULTISPECIES: Gfo/Idh/MocA family oxidoreductase [Azospirillum]MDR6775566.1 phthalate 4,5-cis-dihydrodiol dehydrogenase [Azospirillum sp. BE72]PGH58995.1 4,5-dihydroxyphthalate dehydrogenase [Azospirillum palustre]